MEINEAVNLTLGEHFNKNEKANFELMLYALSDINKTFRTHGLFVVYLSQHHGINYQTMTYDRFHDQIHELAFSHLNKLLNLYAKKKGNSQKLLKELLNRRKS